MAAVLASAVLAGCAGQPNVSVNVNADSDKTAEAAETTEAAEAKTETTETSEETEDKADAAGDKETINVLVGTMGTYSPFSYYDENENLTGYDIEVVRKIEEVDPSVHFEFESGAWESLFPGLDSGKFQMLANQIASTEERREKYYLTENTYFVATNQLVVRSDNDEITSFEDLVKTGGVLGLTVGDNHNEEAEIWNEEHDADNQLNIQYYNEDVTTILQDIDNGRIAATLNDPAVAVSKAEIQGLKVKPVGKPVDQVPVHFVFIKDDNGAELLSRVDAALGKLKESGELAKLSTEWFDADYTEVRPE